MNKKYGHCWRKYSPAKMITEIEIMPGHYTGGFSFANINGRPDSPYVHHSLFYHPQQWLGRILQETTDARFLPCQRGLFEKNLIVIDKSMWAVFYIGKGTRPESFILRRNVWNRPASEVKESLPSAEIGGIYDLAPALRKLQTGQLVTVSSNSILRSVGPWAYRSLEFADEFADIYLPRFGFPRLREP
jgi:hypothetical protein